MNSPDNSTDNSPDHFKGNFDLTALLAALDVSTVDRHVLNTDLLETTWFEGENVKTPHGRIFGGQVLAQSIIAADKTVESHAMHSLHGYFVRAGLPEFTTEYKVENIRDGRSFTTRQVSAIQNNKPIFIMQASFQAAEESFEHQMAMPDVPQPEDLMSDQEFYAANADKHERFKMKAERSWPIEIKHIDGPWDINPDKRKAVKSCWMKTHRTIPGDFPENQGLHKAVFSYASDMGLLATSLLPHGATFPPGQFSGASLDHAMWFYRPFRFDEWLLYVHESPVAYGARGLNRANVFNQQGELVAAVTQEGLIRRNKNYQT